MLFNLVTINISGRKIQFKELSRETTLFFKHIKKNKLKRKECKFYFIYRQCKIFLHYSLTYYDKFITSYILIYIV